MEDEEFEALQELRRVQRESTYHLLDDDSLICECWCISAGDIRELLGNNKTIELNFLSERLGLGTGCSGCKKSFADWKDKIF